LAEKSKEDARHFSGLVFVACMFIGAGVGLAFGRPDVGGAIGMGVGFFLMGLIRVKGVQPQPITLSLPSSFPALTVTVLGVIVILAGVFLLWAPEMVYPYLAAFAAIAVGVLILAGGLAALSRRSQA